MPSPLPHDASRLDDALKWANRLRHEALKLRRAAFTTPYLAWAFSALADANNAAADHIMAAMKESRRC